MPEWVEDCVGSVRPRLRKKYPSASKSRIDSRAYAICNAAYKKHGGKEAINVENIVEEFGLILGDLDMAELNREIFYWQSKMNVSESLTEAMKFLDEEQHVSPIVDTILREEASRNMATFDASTVSDTSAYTVSPDYGESTNLSESVAGPEVPHIFISGEAIHAGTTRNMNQYLASELAKAAPSLVGKPIQTDHSHKSIDTVGKVIAASFDQNTSTLKYVGRLQKGEKVTEKVRVGDLDTVSIGAVAKDIVCGVCGTSRIIRSGRNRGCKHAPGDSYDGEIATNVGIGIDFVELSLTPVPADPRASAMAVTHDSMESALFALAESFQHKGEKTVSENEAQDPEMIEALRGKNMELEAALEAAQLREKQRLANGIAGAEIRLGQLTEKDKELRLKELVEKPIEALDLLSKALENIVTRQAREAPMSKGKITESESQDEGITYNELKAFIRRRVFNWDAPSASAVSKVQAMAMNPQSEMHPEYVRFLGLGGNQ